MTLRKIAVDNSVKHIAQTEQSQSISRDRDCEPNTNKNKLRSRKQHRKLSQSNIKLFRSIFGEGFAKLKGITNSYF